MATNEADYILWATCTSAMSSVLKRFVQTPLAQKYKAEKSWGCSQGRICGRITKANRGLRRTGWLSPRAAGCSIVEFQPFKHNWKHREESVSAKVAI